MYQEYRNVVGEISEERLRARSKLSNTLKALKVKLGLAANLKTSRLRATRATAAV